MTYRLDTDADCTNEITKVGDNTVEFSKTSTGVTVTCNGETKTPTDLTYKLYKFSDLREEVKTIGNSAVFVPSVDKVIVGTGTNAKNNSSISKTNNSYIYSFGDDNKEYHIGNSIIRAKDLKNVQSDSVLILSNNHSTDYVTLTQKALRTIGTSTYNVLRIYVKTSDFDRSDFGLNIEIEAVDVKWININTTNSTKKDEYGFVCYEVLIQSNKSDSISNFGVKLSLGNESNTSVGYAIISKISLDSLSSADEFKHYSNLVGDDNENIKKAIYENKADETKDEEKDADDKNSVSWAVFFYIFSSILLVATMAVALVALILKKHPIKGSQKFENDHERDIETKSQTKTIKSTKSTKKDVVIGFENEDHPTITDHKGGIE